MRIKGTNVIIKKPRKPHNIQGSISYIILLLVLAFFLFYFTRCDQCYKDNTCCESNDLKLLCGADCEGEIIGSNTQNDCIGGWGEWSDCTVECGGGLSERTYSIFKEKVGEGRGCYYQDMEKQNRVCNIEPCSNDCNGYWTDWGNCSNICKPGGIREKTFIITNAQGIGGDVCRDYNGNEITQGTTMSDYCNTDVDCPINCEGRWSEWSQCSKECINHVDEEPGIREKTFTVQHQAQYGGIECPAADNTVSILPCNEDILCHTQDCEGTWSTPTPCDKECGGGIQFEYYSIPEDTLNRGNVCPHSDGTTRTQVCNTDPCPINCEGSWVYEDGCVADTDNNIETPDVNVICGPSMKQMTYTVSVEDQYGGSLCFDHTNTQRRGGDTFRRECGIHDVFDDGVEVGQRFQNTYNSFDCNDCTINQYVDQNRNCVDCPQGEMNLIITNPIDGITTCSQFECPVDQKISGNECINCPEGQNNQNHIRSNGMHRQTECEDIICEVDQYVSGTAAGVVGQCVDCLPHRERPFRDNVNNGDTSCSDIHCSANEYVRYGYCLACPAGFQNRNSDGDSRYINRFSNTLNNCLNDQQQTPGTAGVVADTGGEEIESYTWIISGSDDCQATCSNYGVALANTDISYGCEDGNWNINTANKANRVVNMALLAEDGNVVTGNNCDSSSPPVCVYSCNTFNTVAGDDDNYNLVPYINKGADQDSCKMAELDEAFSVCSLSSGDSNRNDNDFRICRCTGTPQ